MDRTAAEGDAPHRLDPVAWVAVVSHDLREPMNAILGMTRLLLETRLDATQRAHAEAVEDAATGMLTLINDLLDVSRLEHGELRVEREPFDLHRLLHRCLELVRPRVEPEAVTLRLEIGASVPEWVTGDAGRLRQVLVNLLVNAIKFTKAGTIGVAIAPAAADRLAFTVTDSGCGLPEAEIERLFRPFEQIQPGAGGGVGLGLTIVRLLVERLGGTVAVTSAVGVGTRVTVELPLPAAAAAARARRVPVAGRSVWLVGGNEAVRARTGRQLEAAGLEVTVVLAEAVGDAADRTGVALPDALLLVATAPDAPVAAAAAALKRGAPDLLLLAVESPGLRGEAQAWRRAGFDAYLPQPAPGEVIVDALGVLSGAAPGARSFVTAHSLADRSTGPLQVLVVDDNPLNVRLVAILLERAGHRVAVADDGASAVRLVEAGGIDVVLMDIQMPGMDGLEATRRIRALGGEVAGTPIIAVTANALPGDLAACREVGMDDVVTKPVETTSLLAALDAAAVGTAPPATPSPDA